MFHIEKPHILSEVKLGYPQLQTDDDLFIINYPIIIPITIASCRLCKPLFRRKSHIKLGRSWYIP